MICLITILIAYVQGAVFKNIPELNSKIRSNETFAHLQEARVQRYCADRARVCASGGAAVCAVTHSRAGFSYRQYNNSCFLFMANMCDHPDQEYHIVSSGGCGRHLRARRHGLVLPPATSATSRTTRANSTTKAAPGLRSAPLSTVYDIDTAFDYHKCPLACPNTYEPVCVCANRNEGLYYKFFSFSNHCEGDRYYCGHWQEFSPPPGEDEKVQSSFLGWSYCGSSKYLMFARFAEASASLGHYGWLQGDYKFSHIMEPHERQPGYG